MVTANVLIYVYGSIIFGLFFSLNFVPCSLYLICVISFKVLDLKPGLHVSGNIASTCLTNMHSSKSSRYGLVSISL